MDIRKKMCITAHQWKINRDCIANVQLSTICYEYTYNRFK